MFCPKCGAVIPNGVHNCVQCGTIVQNRGFGAQVGNGMNNMGNTAYQGVNQAGGSVNRAASSLRKVVHLHVKMPVKSVKKVMMLLPCLLWHWFYLYFKFLVLLA